MNICRESSEQYNIFIQNQKYNDFFIIIFFIRRTKSKALIEALERNWTLKVTSKANHRLIPCAAIQARNPIGCRVAGLSSKTATITKLKMLKMIL